MLPVCSFSTYSRSPLLVRLIGSVPPEATRSTNRRPCPVTWKALIVLSPALTANSRRPPFVRSSAPCESVIGNPNGGCAARPRPPVATLACCVIVPSRLRANTTT